MFPWYRTWTRGEEIIITVGIAPKCQQFTGHRQLLAEQSGYIKSLLDATQGNQISIPNISPEIFAPILSFMYTGYLDLNPENVYGVLLATHLLHMPRAVDLCRGYLLQYTPTLRKTPTLVKPIPSRKYWPTIYWAAPPIFTAPVGTSAYVPKFSVATPDSAASTSAPPRDTTPTTIEVQQSAPQKEQHKAVGKVVKDVACCDGPVRFKRVLNINYVLQEEIKVKVNQLAEEDDSNSTQSEKGEGKKRLFICHLCKHTFKSHYCYRKHTRRHLNPIPTSETSNANPDTNADMNVQYYPCKTCGSKFPSYYFVHKHRKICHPSESAPSSVSKASSTSKESSCSPTRQ